MKFPTAAVLVAASAVVAAAADSSEAQWRITSIDSGARDNLCQRQIQTCQNNCGGPEKAPMAFCNGTTMAWGCGCAEKTPDFEKWNWPVPAADCAGSATACRTNCNTAAGDRAACFNNCDATHKCNTEDAPVSYTETTDVAAVPKYVGPAVSYSGKQLGSLNDGNDRPSAPANDSSVASSEEAAARVSSKSGAAGAVKATVLAVAGVVAAAFAF
ncbi:hypothetical protein IWQ57_003280 [Coemansia nantahalensis]|uniref:Uncharacterized protein n=1 Tax=Coemansia nantahalensis TaxID=2789366 RepID=A0ACC1JX25_9FUNG|nr:hypothetical protein IWQ57_003280 [Coemansia nantahalensis]